MSPRLKLDQLSWSFIHASITALKYLILSSLEGIKTGLSIFLQVVFQGPRVTSYRESQTVTISYFFWYKFYITDQMLDWISYKNGTLFLWGIDNMPVSVQKKKIYMFFLFNPYKELLEEVLLSPFYRWGNWTQRVYGDIPYDHSQ